MLIPTRDRPGYVKFLIGRLVPLLEESALSWEILVSENPTRAHVETATNAMVTNLRDKRIRYWAHCPAFETGEENIFSALPYCEGKWVWTCADDDYPRSDALHFIGPIIERDEADFILCNACILNSNGTVIHSEGLAPALVGEPLNPFQGTLIDFVRKTGFLGFITTMSSALFKREFVAAIDWQVYTGASPIYSHSAIYMEAFGKRRFTFVSRPVVNFLRGGDTESRWDRLAKSKGVGLRYPWSLGLIRLISRLEQRHVISPGFMFVVTEVNESGRFLLANHTVSMITDQVMRGIETLDSREMYTQGESIEFLAAFATGSHELLKALSGALALNDALAPFIRTLSARKNYEKSALEDRRLSEIMMTIGEIRFSNIVGELRLDALSKLDAIRQGLTLSPPVVKYVGDDGDSRVYKVGSYTLLVGASDEPPRTEYLPRPGGEVGVL